MTAVDPAQSRQLTETLAANPDGVLESLAAEHGLSLEAAIRCLPETHRALADGCQFAEAMADIAQWGTVTVLVHTADLILECTAELPPGRPGHGFFNLHGRGPLGGHIRAENCATLAFVSRPFMGLESHAVIFLNQEGAGMFKVFVGRDAERRPRADQLARFTALRDRLTATAGEAHHGAP